MIQKKFNTESASIQYLIKELTKRGYTDIHATQTANQFEHYDVSATHPLGYKYEMEVKRRYFDSTKYGDTVIEQSKYNKFLNDKWLDNIDGAWVVTMFNDCWTISNALQPIFTSEKEVQHTTEFGDSQKVKKTFMHYKLKQKFNYDTL